jgi:formate dehydrogenase subunit delta
MNVDRLVAMVNDIAKFFDAEPDLGAASAGVAQHLKRFWDPRMRRQIIAHYHAGGAGLSDTGRAGVARLIAIDARQEPKSPSPMAP